MIAHRAQRLAFFSGITVFYLGVYLSVEWGGSDCKKLDAGRAALINMLREYSPEEAEEQGFKERMIAFITEHEDCFERTLEVGHLSASALLLIHQ